MNTSYKDLNNYLIEQINKSGEFIYQINYKESDDKLSLEFKRNGTLFRVITFGSEQLLAFYLRGLYTATELMTPLLWD